MNNLKNIRKKQNITITELSKKVGMSQANLTKIENNQIELKVDLAQKIALVLGVSIDTIIDSPSQNNKIELINPETLKLPKFSAIDFPIPNNKPHIKGYILPDDTMATLFSKHSIAIIDTLKNIPENGVFLISINNITMLRRLQLLDNKHLLILTENKSYNTFEKPINDINILGKAISVITHTLI